VLFRSKLSPKDQLVRLPHFASFIAAITASLARLQDRYATPQGVAYATLLYIVGDLAEPMMLLPLALEKILGIEALTSNNHSTLQAAGGRVSHTIRELYTEYSRGLTRYIARLLAE
jgi:hypothetical protein